MMDGLFPMASWLIFLDREIANCELLSWFNGKGDYRSMFSVLTHRELRVWVPL